MKLNYENIYDRIIEIIKGNIENNSEYDEDEGIGTFDCSDVDHIAEDSATEIITAIYQRINIV